MLALLRHQQECERRMMEGWIQLWYTISTFVNVTMLYHNNYNMIEM
jgi:hypothetical protein